MHKECYLYMKTKEQKDTMVKTEEKKPRIYTYEEAVKAATNYFQGDDLAGSVWVNKYALK